MSDLSPQSETKRTLIRSLSPISQFYEYTALIAKMIDLRPTPHLQRKKNSFSADSRVKLLKILTRERNRRPTD